MRFKKLQINGFGNIDNKNIELANDINLIYGNNESGKSTLTDFIKCIFYGINKNKSGNEFSEVELHKPWKTAEFSGKIEYEIDNKSYTAFREFNRNNCKVYDESGTEITAEFSKDKSRGSELGLNIFGIDEETFVNTMLVRQNNSEVELQSQKSIIQKLTNILQSGQESVSLEKIKLKLQKKVLDEIGTDRTHNKPINIVRKELLEKEQTRNRLLNNRDRKKYLEEKTKSIKNQIEKVQADIKQIESVLSIKERYIALLDEKERTFELTQKIKEKERKDKLESNKKLYRNSMTALIFITLFASIALIIFDKTIWILAEFIIAILGAIIINTTNKEMTKEEEETDFDVIKEELNKKENKELDRLIQNGIKSTFVERKASELRTLKEGLEKNRNDLELECHKIKIEEDSLKENIEHLFEVEEQILNLQNQKEELITKAKVINIALQKLDEAYEELKSEIIPELQRNIKDEIKKTTNGKYINAIYNNEEGILIENQVGELVPISKLSIGTIDQMYLGFRLGVSKKIKDVPIILDESFAYYDNERLENIIKCFSAINRQMIILTCSDREKNLLDKLKVKYNYISMNSGGEGCEE